MSTAVGSRAFRVAQPTAENDNPAMASIRAIVLAFFNMKRLSVFLSKRFLRTGLLSASVAFDRDLGLDSCAAVRSNIFVPIVNE